ncbi:MAG: class I SAM-dependent methyltransferase, partial [Pseudomonadota bacterium]
MTTNNGAAARPYRQSRPMRLMLALGHHLAIGEITVVLPDGSQRHFAGSEPGPRAYLQINRDRLARRTLAGGSLGFCEAYLDGDWSSPDVESLFIFFLKNQERLQQQMQGKAWYRALNYMRHLWRPNDRKGARRNIHAHYDLGNGFYQAWLDPSMTYSSALFGENGSDLEAAQQRKYAALADRIGLAPDHSVLEIGCGWGGFAAFAAGERGAKVTGLTISQAQHDYAKQRVFEAGLAERV